MRLGLLNPELGHLITAAQFLERLAKIEVFFQQCKKQKTDWKTENYEAIRNEYLKLFDNADDKMQIASQLYDLVSSSFLSGLFYG